MNINDQLEELKRVLDVIVEQQEYILKSLKATVEGLEDYVNQNYEEKINS